MKFLLLLSVTVAFVATGTEGLWCYSTDNSPSICGGQNVACHTERRGLEKYAFPMLPD